MSPSSVIGSLTAGSASTAEASLVRTMFQALKLCLPVILMTFALFTRFNLVVKPAVHQLPI